MEDLKQVGSAEAIRRMIRIATTAAHETLRYQLLSLSESQQKELINNLKSYVIDNGVYKSSCFKIVGIDLFTEQINFRFTDSIGFNTEWENIQRLPFETKLFLIELIEKL